MSIDIDALIASVLNGEVGPKDPPPVAEVPMPVVETVSPAQGGDESYVQEMLGVDLWAEAPMLLAPEPVAPEPVAPEPVAPEPVPVQTVVETPTPRSVVASAGTVPVPQFSLAELADSFSVRDFGLLVTLSSSRWYAKVKDKKAARGMEATNSATEGAYVAYKHLLAGSDAKLRKITRALDQARLKHYSMTMPWTETGMGDEQRRRGPRLLPNTLVFDYVAEMSRFRKEMDAALADFLPDYPALVQAAQVQLGRGFDSADYPDVTKISDMFRLDFSFTPVPEGADFRGLEKQQLEKLASAINDKTKVLLENAMQDVWTRLHTAVSHMEERLSSPDKIFHDTLVENIRELAGLMEHLNVTHDTRLTELRTYILKHIAAVDADTLRKESTVRSAVAVACRNVLHTMKEEGQK